MRTLHHFVRALIASVVLASGPTLADQISGMGNLSGKVTVAKPVGQLTVYALNTDKNVGYMVYVVKGAYRAVNIFPGHYEISLRGTVGQLNWSLPQQTVKIEVAAGKTATADFSVTDTTIAPTYVGGMPYPDAKIEPYDKVYPKGRGRELLENICFGCHTVHLYPYNMVRTYPGGRPAHDKAGWAITIDRMAKGVAFNARGKASMFDSKLLSDADRDILINYMTENFGEDSTPRAVLQVDEPALDEAALAKAQYVEYRFPNTPGDDDRFVHTSDFDSKGNVWIMDRGAQSLVEVNPRTGTFTDHKGHGGGEYLAVDIDDTIWYGGWRHYDPRIKKHDEYKFEGGTNGRPIPISSMVFDSKGDLWGSTLTGGGIAKWDRKTDKVTWWDVPVIRSRPYGISLDHNDKVWFAEYHSNGISSFDPKTEEFRHYRVTPENTSNIRRVTADSKNFMWTATWGSRAMQNGALYRVDPNSGESVGYKIPISNTNPYDSDVDDGDNVWVATDNHILMFDQKSKKFTIYPTPERTDIPMLSITRDRAIWYGPRNAGQSGGYGGAAGVLFPDKDKVKDLGAYYAKNSWRDRKANAKAAPVAVTGATKLSPARAKNAGAYEKALGLPPLPDDAGMTSNTIRGGAAQE